LWDEQYERLIVAAKCFVLLLTLKSDLKIVLCMYIGNEDQQEGPGGPRDTVQSGKALLRLRRPPLFVQRQSNLVSLSLSP
jgi:hypothetical protein